MNFYKLLLVGAGGFFGSVLRYITSRSIDEKLNAVFPYGTLTVNLIGSFILGVVYAVALKKTGDSENLRLLFGTGFCGGFTTFSAFAFENVNLIGQKFIGVSTLYIGTSLILGFLALWAGMMLGRTLA